MDKALSGFRANVRAEIRALWNGERDQFTFIDNMVFVIERGLTQAWAEGAKVCGVKLAELTPVEKYALEDTINGQFAYLPTLASFITANSKANKGKLSTVFRRANYWVNQYNSTANRAKTMACQDQKLKWEIDPGKKNCDSCVKLNGKVKRASFWAAAGVRPQNYPNDKLFCTGILCGCELKPTDDPITPGPLPRLP